MLMRRPARASIEIVVAGAIAASLAAWAKDIGPAEVADQIAAARRQEAAGDAAAAIKSLTELLAAPDGLDPASRARVGADLASLHFKLGDYAEAMALATAAAADAELGGDLSAQSRAEFMVGMVHRSLQQLDDARRAFRASARLARDSGDTNLWVRALNEEGNVLAMTDDLEGALAPKLEALHDLGDEVEPGTRFSLENDTAFVYSLLDRPADALPHFERAWQLGLELGNRRAAAYVACNLAGCLAALGDPASGIPWAERGLAIAVADGLLPAEEHARAVLGELLAGTGDPAAAVVQLHRAYELRKRILGEDSARRIAELGSRHEAERREAEIELLRRDAEIRELELLQARNQRRLMVGALVALAAFVAVLAAAYRFKVRANAEIRAANLELDASRRRVEELSRTDALTGLANRRSLEERLADEARRYERSGRSFAVVLADIDLFKEVNDRFGHEAGDEVLSVVARRLRAGVRAIDLAGRWGGEEFLIVLPDTEIAGARELAEKLRRCVADQPVPLRDTELSVTLTLGLATHAGATVEGTIRRADAALYRGKHDGRNRVTVG